MTIAGYKQPSTQDVPSDFLDPDTFVRTTATLREDYEYGGAAIQDPSAGFWFQVWKLWVQNDQVLIAPRDNPAPPQVLFTAPDIREVTFTFDNNMMPVVSYVQAGITKLYWYDLTQVPPAFVTTTVGGLNASPFLTFDDKRARMIGQADIILFYIVGQEVKYRLLRDRFLVEYTWCPLPKDATRIAAVGMSEGNRLQLVFELPVTAPPFLWRLDDANVGYSRLDFGDVDLLSAYTSNVSDKLYVTTETGFAEFAGGATDMEYTWLSGERFYRPPVSFAVGLVDATGTGSIDVYADGILRTSVSLNGRTRFHIPAGRPARRWSVALKGTAKVRKVEMGMSFGELKSI